jgi:GNAT superfamily N-acetyltransferase
MDEIIIRKATLADLAQLLVFEQGVINAERPFDETLKTGHTCYYDIDRMIAAAEVELLVAETAGRLVGSGYARIEESKPYLRHTQHAYLGFMYVVPEQRGKGINKMIIADLIKWVASKNITELRLDVYYPNASAIAAYEKAGFSRHMIAMRRGL